MIIFKQKLELWGGFVMTQFGNKVLAKLVTVTNQSKFEGKRETQDKCATIS